MAFVFSCLNALAVGLARYTTETQSVKSPDLGLRMQRDVDAFNAVTSLYELIGFPPLTLWIPVMWRRVILFLFLPFYLLFICVVGAIGTVALQQALTCERKCTQSGRLRTGSRS